MRLSLFALLGSWLAVAPLAGCAVHDLALMATPEAISDGVLDGSADNRPVTELPGGGMLYVTDRQPGSPTVSPFYRADRGFELRVGVADVDLGATPMTWDEARRISLLKNKPDSYPLKVSRVDEYGFLLNTHTLLSQPDAANIATVRRKFAAAIDSRLGPAGQRDVYIYVHGYKVDFENPVLVGAELWHFLGYQGAMIAYSWPATPKTSAYVGDIETASGMARNLRQLIEFVENETHAERIHVIGYSAGTRLVGHAMEQVALINHGRETAPGRLGRKLETVVLISSDLDRAVFASYVADGMLTAQKHLLIYGSDTDKALGMSRLLTGHKRLGSMFKKGQMTPAVTEFLNANRDRVSYVDVSGAPDVNTGNGHAYFRNSPWVSSDLLMKLAYRLSPEDRGLQRDPQTGVLSFPSDYVDRMRTIQTKSFQARAAERSPAHPEGPGGGLTP